MLTFLSAIFNNSQEAIVQFVLFGMIIGLLLLTLFKESKD